MPGLPLRRSEPYHMRYFRPFPPGAGNIQPISPDIPTFFRGDMLRQFQEETCHGKGFGFSLEEVIVGGVGDQGGTDQILLEEKLDDHPAEILRHSFDIPEGDMDKPAGLVEAALQHEAMKKYIDFHSRKNHRELSRNLRPDCTFKAGDFSVQIVSEEGKECIKGLVLG